MNSQLKIFGVVMLNFTLLVNCLLAELPPIHFDAPEYVPFEQIDLHDSTGWNLLSGAANVSSSGEGYGGGQALKLPQGPEEAWLRREISWDSNEKTAFIDFQIKPAAEPEGSLANFVANGSQIAFQVPSGSATGRLWVYNGGDAPNSSAQWFVTPGSFAIAPGANVSSTWTRVTLRHDYHRDLWDLFIDGKLAAVNLSFEGREQNLATLEFFGSHNGDTLVDDVSVQKENMLFADADKDALPDAWEIANGSNPNLYDRESVKPGTGKSFLDNYLDSIWVTGSTVANGATGTGSVGTIPALTILGDHQPVGSLKGALSVGGDGSANYSMPIDLPKGTGGMEPKISLSYSSGGGNGMTGLGWGLTGFQKITRGASSAAKDGSYDPMNFNSSDRFFLDGERLVCVQGVYGEAGSVYRTEIDSFARITAIGNGPISWKVETKAGLIISLGGTSDSKTQVAQGTLTWGVNRVADTLGNYYDVEYARDSAGTEPFDFVNDRISVVHYTGNLSRGMSPYCHVYFDYENRTDVSRAYTNYAGYKVSKRLSKIRVLTNNYINHSYRLAYINSYQTGRSLLTSVSKMMQDSPSLAIPATVFNYDGLQEGQPIWLDPGNNTLPVYSAGIDSTSAVNSAVSVEEDGGVIRLDGDVARAFVLPSPITVYPDTTIQFKFKSSKLGSGGIIGLDSDLTYQENFTGANVLGAPVAPSPFFRIGGTGDIQMAPAYKIGSYKRTPVFVGPTQSYAQPNWVTFTLNAGQFATGVAKYLVLMCADDNITDGLDEALFKDIRIYRSGGQQPEDVAPLNISVGTQLPRLYATGALSTDMGIVPIDLNADGLVDLADWQVVDYPLNTQPTLFPKTLGNAYLNTGAGFQKDNTFLPPSSLPLSVRDISDFAFKLNQKHQLVAQPMDVNSDGQLDFLVSINIQSPGNLIKNEYAFYTWTGSAWTQMTGWDLPFRFENSATESYGGKRRAHHFQWLDLNGDGYQDLVILTSTNGRLFDRFTNAPIGAGYTTVAYINKGKDGPGWIRDASYSLPELLANVDGAEVLDLGRRVLDLDGDGFPEIAESTYNGL